MEESSKESAYDTLRTVRQRCRRRLQDQKRQMNQNREANLVVKTAKAQGATERKPTPVAKPLSAAVSRDGPLQEDDNDQGNLTVEPESRRTVMVDFFDAQAPGKCAGNAHRVSIVKDKLHKLVVGPSKGKIHVTRVQYDRRFPQERRVTLSYEGSKAVAIGVLNDKVWRALGWRKG